MTLNTVFITAACINSHRQIPKQLGLQITEGAPHPQGADTEEALLAVVPPCKVLSNKHAKSDPNQVRTTGAFSKMFPNS